MSLAAVLSPVFVQVLMTFLLGFWMARERAIAIKAGAVGKDAVLYPVCWPEQAQKVSNSFHNQLEMPILFYALVAFALMTQKADFLFVVLSWLFVGSRLVHAYVHTTSNILKWRGSSFVVGVFILFAMWIIFASRILFL